MNRDEVYGGKGKDRPFVSEKEVTSEVQVNESLPGRLRGSFLHDGVGGTSVRSRVSSPNQK